jgi:hypothetical protein
MKFKTFYILFIILLSIPFVTNAQRWKRTRYEVLGGIGPSLFFGDLGGSNKDAKHFMGDIDFPAMRYHLMVGVRYKLKEKMALKLNLIYGRVHGSDTYTESPGRARRNVTFSSGLFEPSVQYEYSVLKERLGNRYTFRNLSRFKLTYVNTYVFIGVGGLLFYPKPELSAASSNVIKHYSHFNLVIPIGIGFKYAANRRICVGLEFGQRYTSTDYLDGHSDKYSKARDSYSFLTLNVTYKLKTARSGLPKF